MATEDIQLDLNQVKDLYDKMSGLVYSDMDKQFKEGKINGSDYADTWAKLMDSVVAGAMSTIAQLQMKETALDRDLKEKQLEAIDKDIELKDEQIDSSKATTVRNDGLASVEVEIKEEEIKVKEKDIDLKQEQIDFTKRQTEGFDDSKEQKMLDIQMNAWAMMFSSGLMSEVPAIVSGDNVSTLYCKMQNDIGIPDSGDVCDPCSSVYNESDCIVKMCNESPGCHWDTATSQCVDETGTPCPMPTKKK